MSGAEIQRVLALAPLFATLDSTQRARLAERVTTRAYPANAVIVRQGSASMSCYVVLSGTVVITREPDGAGGSPVEVERLGAGGTFGEMGLIDDQTRAATARAVEPAVCALLAKWDFERELRADPELALAILRTLGGRIRALDALLVQSTPSETR